MLTPFRLAAAVLTLAACTACGGGDSPAPSAQSSSPQASTQFGTPECDAYMSKYLACIDRMPADARAAARQSLEQTQAAWKQAASTEQGRAVLAATCKAASDATGPTMQAYGCTW